MDNQEEALNEIAESETSEIATPAVEKESEGEASGQESTQVDELDLEAETSAPESKKGYSARIRELNARAKKAEEERDSFAARLEALTGNNGDAGDYPQLPQIKDEPIVAPGEEIDTVELDRRLRAREQKLLQHVDAISTLRAKQNEAITRINNETVEVVRKYPELDPNNESFDKDLSDAVTEATEAYIKQNPYSASVVKFVDKMMRPYKGAVSKEVGNMTKEVAKQVSASAVRPTSVRQKEKPASEMTTEELERKLGIVQA